MRPVYEAVHKDRGPDLAAHAVRRTSPVRSLLTSWDLRDILTRDSVGTEMGTPIARHLFMRTRLGTWIKQGTALWVFLLGTSAWAEEPAVSPLLRELLHAASESAEIEPLRESAQDGNPAAVQGARVSLSRQSLREAVRAQLDRELARASRQNMAPQQDRGRDKGAVRDSDGETRDHEGSERRGGDKAEAAQAQQAKRGADVGKERIGWGAGGKNK